MTRGPKRLIRRVFVAALCTAALMGCGAGGRPVTLLFAGDVMLGRHVEEAAKAQNDWAFPFRRMADRLRAARIGFANLECVAAADGSTEFQADPQMLRGLRDVGFDVISLANNHTMDGGPEALREMVGRLRDLGLVPIGVRYLPERQSLATVDADGLRVGFLAYSWATGDFPPVAGMPSIAQARIDDMTADIARARSAVDYLVVSLHMGTELARRSNEAQQQKARAAIDAGADLVVGHHPHVPQEFERYGRGFIAYSLGDFVFDHPELSVDGALLEVTLAAGRPVRIVWTRTRINAALQPEPIGETVWTGDALVGPDASLN